MVICSVRTGPELSNPVDPNSDPTGDTVFVLSEVYETPAGVAEHWKPALVGASARALTRRCRSHHVDVTGVTAPGIARAARGVAIGCTALLSSANRRSVVLAESRPSA